MVDFKACNLLECRVSREQRAWTLTSSRILVLIIVRRRWALRPRRMSSLRFSLFTCHLRAKQNLILVSPISKTLLGRLVASRDCESSLAPIMSVALDPRLLAVPRFRANLLSREAEFNTKIHSKSFLLYNMIIWAQIRSSHKTVDPLKLMNLTSKEVRIRLQAKSIEPQVFILPLEIMLKLSQICQA